MYLDSPRKVPPPREVPDTLTCSVGLFTAKIDTPNKISIQLCKVVKFFFVCLKLISVWTDLALLYDDVFHILSKVIKIIILGYDM